MILKHKSLYKFYFCYKADTQPFAPQDKRVEQDLSGSLLLHCTLLKHCKNGILTSAAFSFHCDKIEHHPQAVANHCAVEIFGRKCF